MTKQDAFLWECMATPSRDLKRPANFQIHPGSMPEPCQECELLSVFLHHYCDVNPKLGGGNTASWFALQAPENRRAASGNLFTFYLYHHQQLGPECQNPFINCLLGARDRPA